MAMQGVEGKADAASRERDLRDEHQKPAVDSVGDRATEQRAAETGTICSESDQADVEGRVGELEHLVRDRDDCELRAERGDEVTAPKSPEACD